MSEPILTLRSSIRPSLVRQAVMRGSYVSGAGGLLLLVCGAFLPMPLLKFWGFPIFLFGIALVTWGLWPYRRLKSIENNPYRIIVDDKEWLHFSGKGKPILSIPLENICKMEYMEIGDNLNNYPYGIVIFLKEAGKHKPVRHQPNIDKYIYRSARPDRLSCNQDQAADNLILPYFSKYAFQELSEHYTNASC